MSKSVNTDEPEEPPFSDEEDFDAEEPEFDSGNFCLFPSWFNINVCFTSEPQSPTDDEGSFVLYLRK